MRVMPLVFAAAGAGLAYVASNKEDKAFHSVIMAAVGYGIASAISDVNPSGDKTDTEREGKSP
jgi:pyrroline-5-carboxylate reductase